MIAIHTRSLAPTDKLGTRIKARAAGFEATIPYPYGYDRKIAHYQAVKALVKKHNLTWDVSTMYWGDSPDGKGYVFCFPKSVIVDNVN